MLGPYHNDWKGPFHQHPSNEATPEEIRSLQTVEDVRRMFPDIELSECIHQLVMGPGGKLVEDGELTPVEAAHSQVQSVRAFNPYTCEAWLVIWTRMGRLRHTLS